MVCKFVLESFDRMSLGKETTLRNNLRSLLLDVLSR